VVGLSAYAMMLGGLHVRLFGIDPLALIW
jgi:hypothetical protein